MISIAALKKQFGETRLQGACTARFGETRLQGACTVGLSVLLTGCARAPSVDILGSFFPGWMISLTLAVFLTFAVRFLLVKLRLEAEVGPLALFYPSLLTLCTCVLWLMYFR